MNPAEHAAQKRPGINGFQVSFLRLTIRSDLIFEASVG
ncbi:hypothetical protein J2S11_002872 [Bacillus horti]|uniref:Uncharacterized protein n=1 Tax=Caldalkalibacillus horti TaxID=77523 RepID=A0ABT9W1G5_9BACI|nr:hypothetical protein [Bacillus horti]